MVTDQRTLFGPVAGDLANMNVYPKTWTVQQRRRAALGLHPANGEDLLGGDATCGTCAHSYPASGSGRNYWKCALIPHTSGPGTDIRLRWPACTRYEEETR